MITVVDPHVHLIALAQGDYHWLKVDNPPYWPDKPTIARDVRPDDLSLSLPFSLEAFVHVEAGFDNANPAREVAFLEQRYAASADPLSTPFATIATCDLTLPTDAFHAQIASLRALRSCVGVRHILDDDARTLLSSQQVLDNLRTLADRQLIFECQCDLTDAWVVEHIVAFHATTSHRWVINHAGIGGDDSHAGSSLAHTSSSLTPLTNWFTHINTLAECPNITVKASGWEMANREYTAVSVTPIIRALVKAFGCERVMLASNFPLTLLRQSYQDYWHMMHQILVDLGLDEEEQRALMGQNARGIYFTTT